MTSVFLLWHVHRDSRLDGGEDVKLIGVYSTMDLAEQAKSRSDKLPGFKDDLEGFEISEYKLNEDNWQEGFVTITHGL